MREIKFRAWDKQKKRISRPFVLGSFAIEWNDGDAAMPLEFAIAEKRVVIDQCISLKDRNNVDVFEGDIVEVKYKGVKKFTGKIFFDQQFLSYMITSPYSVFGCEDASEMEIVDKEGLAGVYKYNTKNYKVIGNIYENPELLSEELT